MSRPLGVTTTTMLPRFSRSVRVMPSSFSAQLYRQGYRTGVCLSSPVSLVSPTVSPSSRRVYTSYYHSHNHFRPHTDQKPICEPVSGVELFRTYLTVDVGGGKRPFDFGQLRDACKCSTCVDQYSKQRNFRTSDIPLSIEPQDVQWDGEQLKIRWSNDIEGYDSSHVSTYDREFLRFPVAYSVDDTSPRRSRYLWNGPRMQNLQHWISYDDYMNDDAKFAAAMKNLSEVGLVFVKDIPDSRDELEKITTRIGPLRNTFYGPTWDVRTVHEAKNVAYTNVFLGFHMDLMYMNEPPYLQLLHCLHNSCDGGESIFADSFRAAVRLHELRPEYFKILERFPVNYEYVHPDQVYHHSRPVIETRRIGPGPAHIHRVNYSPPFQGPQRASHPATWGSNYRQFREALNFFTHLLEEEDASFELKLDPGQCVIFENRRTLHSRRQFNINSASGQRWLAGSYTDEDVALSRYRVLKRNYPEIWAQSVGGSDGGGGDGTSIFGSTESGERQTGFEPENAMAG